MPQNYNRLALNRQSLCLFNNVSIFLKAGIILYNFRVGWRGLVLPLGLLLEASVITAFIHAHWSLDPLALMKAYKFLLTPGAAK